ncbi:VCBS repeat-containing protein [Actinacidiphila glaucinigra]|uniref:VCBS repeat-containing protein n=1 Tax=Actinacidiphila glaucinigra TaxID=235986 RepID=UPI002E2F9E9E|nr:VCBS repeat-containing protein [Actinacidiphila glaucinigra]
MSALGLLAVLTPVGGESQAWGAGCTAGTESDFNGDGVRDVAIADPLATVTGHPNAGQVDVVYGGGKGTLRLTQAVDWVPGDSETGDQFGFALATYDANLDGCSDLVVGAPYEDVGTARDSGAAYVLYGSATGLGGGTTKAASFDEDDSRFVGFTAEAGDWLGYAVAAGKSAAGVPFLAVGAPGESLGTLPQAGAFFYLYGTGFTTTDVNQDSPGVSGGVAERNDRFGGSLAATANHLAVGNPGEAVGSEEFAGSVILFNHTIKDGRPTPLGSITQEGPIDVGASEAGDRFAESLAMVPYRPSGAASATSSLLVVGAPGEDLEAAVDAGSLVVYEISPAGTPLSQIIINQSKPDIDGDGETETGDYFSQKLAAVNTAPTAVGSASTLLVAVGSPGEDTAAGVDTGLVQVFPLIGSPGTSDVVLSPGSRGVPGTEQARDYTGMSLATAGNQLYLGAPYGSPVDRAVLGIPWSAVGAATISPITVWKPGQGGIATDGVVAFGAVAR